MPVSFYRNVLLASSLLLSACGGSDTTTSANTTNLTDSTNTSSVAVLPAIPTRIVNQRGALLDGQLVKTNTVPDSTSAISDPTAKAPAVIPVYDVKQYRVTYQTVDGGGKLTTASGIIAIPQKPAGAKSPLLSFQHGTVFLDKEAPSNDTVATSLSILLPRSALS
uniref:Lipoprotein n=1 Tax=Thiothrix fructosivorans TaxID=111770 RepID=A0A8B0SD95_9GAMM|nr:hypothetical protein J1836_010915 [Thiothrix fructosivorans]